MRGFAAGAAAAAGGSSRIIVTSSTSTLAFRSGMRTAKNRSAPCNTMLAARKALNVRDTAEDYAAARTVREVRAKTGIASAAITQTMAGPVGKSVTAERTRPTR